MPHESLADRELTNLLKSNPLSPTTKPSRDKVLVQTMISRTSARRLDALARARGCSRAAYLKRLIKMHLRAVTPKILRTLDLAGPRPGETS